MTRQQTITLIQLLIQGFSLIVSGLRKLLAELKLEDSTTTNP